MFRKLVSNLPYSPALITEVGFYARRLKNEDVTRRVTVLFVVLTLIMQSLAVFSPPESANASSEQDIIRGGVSDLKDFLARYDHNESDVKDIYSAVGVTRAEIVNAKPGSIEVKDDIYVLSRFGQVTSSSKEVSLAYSRSAGGMGVRYFSPLSATDSSNHPYRGWIGHSAALGWFGIIQANGSLATHGIPNTFSPSTNPEGLQKSISALNLSQNQPAEDVTAHQNDKILYTLHVSNKSNTTASDDFSIRIADILEYARLIDNGGATFDKTSSELSWSAVELAPNQQQERTFVVQLATDIPATGIGASDGSSYDCKMTAAYGNVLSTNVSCPEVKALEAALMQLPQIGTGPNLAFMSILSAVVLFFALRTRQLKKEIRIIRHNFNTGIV